ncbi:MAG: lamin tail domain-containing protein [Bacteroidota bacterium]
MRKLLCYALFLLSMIFQMTQGKDAYQPAHIQAPGDFVIVGFVDGPSGNPKFIELYAINAIPDLSVYGIGVANNGGGTDGVEYTFPAGSLTAGTTIFVANDIAGFTSFMGFAPDYETGVVNFNGDDAIELFENAVVVDVFGDINVDGTGTAWEYQDAWGKRVNGTGPDGSTFILGNWTFGPINVFDNQTTNAGSPVPYPLAPYMPGGGTNPTPVTVELQMKGVIHASATIKAMEFEVLDNIADLSVYAIGVSNNGGGSDGPEWPFPSASASAGDRIYVARDSAAFRDFFGFDADFYDAPGAALNFNGDDGIELFKNGETIEIYGDTLQDGTGEPWEYTLGWAHRNDGTGPDTAGFVLSNWTVSALNALDGQPTNAAASDPYPVLGLGAPQPALVLVGLIHANADVKSSEYYVLEDISDLSVYGLGCANNGGGTDSVEWAFPAASATAGDRIYVTRDSATFRDFFGFNATYYDTSGAAHNFNGDDAFELFENGVVIDVYGEIDVDGTGEPWEYNDTWVQRACATGPDSSTFVLSSWTIAPIDNFNNTTVNTDAAAPYPVDTYQTVPCPTQGGAGGTDLVITEIMYNSPGTDLEYLEIYNNTSSPIDLTGYSITNAVDFTFPSIMLMPDDYLLVSDDSLGMLSFWGVTAYNWTSGSLNDGGEPITIKDGNGTVVDSVNYDDNAPWTRTADGRGPSLELCDVNGDNNLASNWQRSTSSSGKIFNGREVFGSPGIPSTCLATPIVGITAAELIVGESEGSITVFVNMDNPDSANATSVDIAITSGSADNNDYTFTATTLTFPAGTDTSQFVVIPINDDSDQEPEEFFFLQISNPTNDAVITNDTLNIRIIDNDAPITNSLKLIGMVHGPIGGVPKAVELLAVNDIPNLSLYGLGCANNGGGTDGQEYTFPNVSIDAGTCFFVANDTAAFRQFFGFGAEFTDQGSATNFNGDDAFEIFESGQVIDVFGEIDADGTGTPWEYILGWVHRMPNTGPDGSTFVLGNWDISGLRVFEGLSTNAEAATPYPFAMCGVVSNDTEVIPTDIRLYPNPANERLFVRSESMVDQLTIYNMMGQEVLSASNLREGDQLDIRTLAEDVYLIQIQVEGKILTEKLMIQR